MKHIISSIVLTIVVASCATSKLAVQPLTFAPNPVIAHRGAFKAKGLPENSIASLHEAIRLKCTGSEFDVRMSADDSLIINHDPHYGEKEIEKTTFADLRTVPLSNGEPLPTLRQYLLEGMRNNRQTRLVLEIKPSGVGKERGKVIAERVVTLVQKLHAAPYVTYISFDYDILKKIVEISPASPTQYLNGDISPDQLKQDKIGGADYHYSVFKKHTEWIEQARSSKIVLNAWTVNEIGDMQWLLDSKFEFITTNEPALLLSLWATASAKK
ncbi:MAG TPA: glycerophosphodiester phosphodiesterase family protein [Flavisolibacter sp.]|nr:glycerophosphodiester phosphodiesterase family protein [Flavisolibacter sp.]